MTHKPLIAAVAVVLLSSGGCFLKLKSDYDAVAAQLATCQAQAQEAAATLAVKDADLKTCQDQWQQAMKAFGGEAAKTQDVIAGVREWKVQVEQKLPVQVKAEVEAQLNKLVRQLETGFGALATENARLSEAMEKQNQAITTLSGDVSGAREDLIKEVAALRAQRDAAGAKVQDVISQIQKWDQERMLCRDCETRLRLNKKEIEAITAMHGQVVQALAEVK